MRERMASKLHVALSAYHTIVAESGNARAQTRRQVLFVFYLAEEYESTSTVREGEREWEIARVRDR